MKRTMKRKLQRKIANSSLALTLVASMIPFSFSPGVANAEGAGNTATLRILETTDLHNNIMSYDYYQDTSKGINYGLSKTATLIKEARSEVPAENSMLFDAGDTLQGTPMADYVAKVKPLTKEDTHPMFKAMNLLKYDAAIVGNHEFNFGLDFLDTALTNAAFPIVNANIYIDDKDGNPTNDKNYFKPYEIITKKIKDKDGKEQTVKVGVIGFAPPQIMQWDRDKVEGKLIIKDIVKTANKFIPEMKEKGADIIVAVAHSGCDIESEGIEDAENAIFDLTKVSGLDAMLFGHAHSTFPGSSSFNNKKGIDNGKGQINGTPAVEAGRWGDNLGVLDLEIVQQADGSWKADKGNSKAVNRPVTAATAEDAGIVDEVKADHDATLAYVRGKIGETTAPIHTYFSKVTDDAALQLINDAQTDFVKKYITENRPDLKDIPVISAAAPFKNDTNIPQGDISIKSANDLYMYNNSLKALLLTGAQVREWLELCAGVFQKIEPNKEGNQDLIDYNFISYNYDVIDGIKYQIDVTKDARYNRNGERTSSQEHRIIDLTTMDGTPIKDDQEFILATNNHRAGGTGNYPGTGADAKLVVDSLLENREVMMNYIQGQKVVKAVPDNNWKIAPVGGVAKVTFHSSPNARAYLSSTPHIKDLGPSTTKSGFELYELDQSVSDAEKPGKQGWKLENGKWYFYDKDVAKTGWLHDKEKWYFLNSNGVMESNTWVQSGTKWYYMGANGSMVTTSWVQSRSKWYYMGSDGSMITKSWVQSGPKWYYMGSDGSMVTKSWIQSGTKWYYMNPNGSMAAKEWVQSNGKWYFLGSDGKMLENEWVFSNQKWYYLGHSGSMVTTSWVLSGGKWYYLLKNGEMAANTVVQGYKLGGDGAWIK